MEQTFPAALRPEPKFSVFSQTLAFTELLANRRAGTISAISAGGARSAKLQTGRGKNKNTAEKNLLARKLQAMGGRKKKQTGDSFFCVQKNSCQKKRMKQHRRRDYNRDATPQNAATLSQKLFQKAGRHKARDVQRDEPAQLRNIVHVSGDRGCEKSCNKILSAVLRDICRRRGQARHRRRGGEML